MLVFENGLPQRQPFAKMELPKENDGCPKQPDNH